MTARVVRMLPWAVLPLSVWLTGCSQPAPTSTAASAEPSVAAQPATTSAATSDVAAPAPLSPASTTADSAPLVEGRDYTVIKTPLTLEKPDQIEVRDFFWYGCGHCYNLKPQLSNWLASKPADVHFVRTPAALNPVWEQNARAYYTVQGMGKMTEQLHSQLFDAIHQRQQPLFDQPALAAFYAQAGVDTAQFNAAYNSFAVSAQVNQAKQAAQRAGLSGVPALVVNGEYLINSAAPEQMIRTLNGLVERERQAATAVQ